MKAKVFILVPFAWIAGCADVDLTAISAPPPTKEASLDNQDKTITLSSNIALAVECDNMDGPCQDVVITVGDLATVEVHRAYADNLVSFYREGVYAGKTPASVFVVAGKSPGTSNVHFATNNGSVDFSVTVLDD